MIHIIKKHPLTGLILLILIFSHREGNQKNNHNPLKNYKKNKNKVGIIPKINIPEVTLEVVGAKLLVNNIKSNPTIEALSLSSRIIKEENVDKDDYEGFVILKYGVFFHQVQEDLKQALEQCTIAQGVGTMLVQNKALVFLKSNQGDDYKNMITSDNINALNIKSDVSLDVCYWKRYKDHFVVISNAYKMKVKESPKNLALVGKEQTEEGEGESGIEEEAAEQPRSQQSSSSNESNSSQPDTRVAVEELEEGDAPSSSVNHRSRSASVGFSRASGVGELGAAESEIGEQPSNQQSSSSNESSSSQPDTKIAIEESEEGETPLSSLTAEAGESFELISQGETLLSSLTAEAEESFELMQAERDNEKEREIIIKLAAKETSTKKERESLVRLGINKQVIETLYKNSENKIFTSNLNQVIKQIGVIKIASFTHELYNHAANNGKAFERGSFSIEDPKGEIFNMLKELAYKSIPKGYFYPRSPSDYRSSHYKGSDNQYGIDTVFENSPINILPHETHHILFGYVNENNKDTIPKTFIKCEAYGLATWRDTLLHGIEFFHTLVENKKSIADLTRREKDLPSELVEALKKCEQTLLERKIDVTFNAKDTKLYNWYNMVEKILNEEKKNTEQDSLEVINYNDPKLKEAMEDIRKAIINITRNNPNIAKIQSGNEYVIDENDAKKLKEILNFNID